VTIIVAWGVTNCVVAAELTRLQCADITARWGNASATTIATRGGAGGTWRGRRALQGRLRPATRRDRTADLTGDTRSRVVTLMLEVLFGCLRPGLECRTGGWVKVGAVTNNLFLALGVALRPVVLGL
jgi:hypothetical protein